MTTAHLADDDTDGAGGGSEPDVAVYSDYDFWVRERGMKPRPGDLPHTVIVGGKGYTMPPEEPLVFHESECKRNGLKFECVRCGVTMEYCETHEHIHCGCMMETRSGERILPPIRYPAYLHTSCFQRGMATCAMCGTKGKYCTVHHRVHCGCREQDVIRR